MKHMLSACSRIVATGSYVPETVISNADLVQFPAASLNLIEMKTGVRERRHASEGESTSDLAIRAARVCLARAGVGPERVEAIILATSSPDSMQPATAARVQHALGARNAFALDINAVCSGALYGLHLADALVRSGSCATVLLIAAEVYSKILYPMDFSTYPYFGDGAGAVLLSASERPGIRRTLLRTDGSGASVIEVPGGGTRKPYRVVRNERELYFQMKGREVYEFAVAAGQEIVRELLEAEGISTENVRYVVAHQANINILTELSAELGIGMERFAVNLDRYGNTAAASVLIAYDELIPSLAEGDNVVMVTFGGGLSWGACLIVV